MPAWTSASASSTALPPHRGPDRRTACPAAGLTLWERAIHVDTSSDVTGREQHPGLPADRTPGRGLVDAAPGLGVDAGRIAVMGDSGGGGVAASLAIYARDRGGAAIAEQILIYPMLDDRNTTPDQDLVPFVTWSYDDNATGWGALLGDAVGGPDVSPYAAARVEDMTGLPAAYIEVGELDIFRDEDLAYAQRLVAAGVSTELHVHPAVPHAWEALVPTAELSRRSAADRHRVLSSL